MKNVTQTMRVAVVLAAAGLVLSAPGAVFGQISNGDFETPSTYDPSNYLNGWSTYWIGYPETTPNYVQQEEDAGNHWASMHAEGSWSYSDFSKQWYYQSAYARLTDYDVFVPLDATEITLDYKASITDNTGDGLARPTVQFTSSAKAELGAAADWTTIAIPVPEKCRGRRVNLYFKADDESKARVSDPVGSAAPLNNVVDFLVDNVSMDGVQEIVGGRWNSTNGGAWEDSANWRDGVVPSNTDSSAYSVSISHPRFAEFVGPDAVTLSNDVEVQNLSIHNVESLRISEGVSLVARDRIYLQGANIVMEPGSMLVSGGDDIGDPMYVRYGSITAIGGTGAVSTIRAGGSPYLPLRLENGTSANTGGPVLDLTDCIVDINGAAYPEAGIYDESVVTFTRSLACTERVGLLCKDAYISTGASVTFNPGTGAYDGAEIRVFSYKGDSTRTPTLNLHGAEMGGPAEENKIYTVRNYGLTNITGATTFHTTSSRSLSNSQYYSSDTGSVLNITDADLWLSNEFHNGNGGQANIVNSTMKIDDGDISLAAGGEFFADGDSTLICGGFDNQMILPENFDLSLATLVISGKPDAVSRIRCQGTDLGAIMAAFENNFMLGQLRILGDAELREFVSYTAALYVKDLYIADDAVLDLNGIALYYCGELTGGGSIVGGQAISVPEPATLVLLAMGGVGLIGRRRRA